MKTPSVLKVGLVALSLLPSILAYSQEAQPAQPEPKNANDKPQQETNAPAETATSEQAPPADQQKPAVEQETEKKEESKTPAQPVKSSDKVENVQVTGSRLRRVQKEASAPVAVVKKEEIQKTGSTTLGEFFQKNAAASPAGNFTGSSEYVSAGSASIDLLGLGSSRTLILVNGKRMPTLAGFGTFDVDTIPTALVERIEILTGGASAIYGADAVGGVVNVILRKDVQGTEVSASVNVPMRAGGEAQSYNVSQGVSIGDNFRLGIGGGWKHRNAIDVRHRDLPQHNGGRPYTAFNPPANTYSYAQIDANGDVLGGFAPGANCPVENQIVTNPQQAPQNKYCAGERSQPSERTPRTTSTHAATTFDYTVNDDWSLGGFLAYDASKSFANSYHTKTASSPFSRTGYLFYSREAAIAHNIPVTDPNAIGVFVISSLPEAKRVSYTNTNNVFVSSLTLGGILGGWKTDFSMNYANAVSKREGHNFVNRDMAHELFRDQDTQPAYDPLDPDRDVSIYANTRADMKSQEWAEVVSADVFASNSLFTLPGGEFTLGFGANVSNERFKQEPDLKDVALNQQNSAQYAGTFSDRGKGARVTESVYTEFVAPIVKELTVEGALRFDNFSDFGSSFNYGLGTKVSPIEQIAFRGRAASSFKAPPLTYVHQKGGGGYQYIDDTKLCDFQNQQTPDSCDGPSTSNQIYAESPGNKDLDPEVGNNYTFGVILEPLKGLNLSVDYFNVQLKKTFNTESLQDIADDWYRENPNATTGGFVRANEVSVDEDGIITQIKAPIQNLGRTKIRLVRTEFNYILNVGEYAAGFKSTHSRFLSYKSQETPKAKLHEYVGELGLPTWRWQNSLEVGTRKHSVQFAAQTISEQHARYDEESNTPHEMNTKLAVYTEYDMSYTGQLPWDSELSLGVSNIFNTIGGQVVDESLGGRDVYSTSLYSVRGRSYFASYTQRL